MLVAAAILLKVLAIPLLARIAWVDLNEQKIANRDVLLLLALGALMLAVSWLHSGSPWEAGMSALAGLLLFCVLFPFWMMRKLGAGDVKLLAVAPLVVGGGNGLFVFSLFLLVAVLATVILVANPLLLPEGAFRRYVALMDRKRVIPFGVPISASLTCVLILQLWQMPAA